MTDVAPAAPEGGAPVPASAGPLDAIETGVANALVSAGFADCKPFMQSLTIIGALLTVASAAAPLVLSKAGVSGGVPGAIVAAASAAGGIIGGTLAIIGRLRAKTTLT